MHDDPEFQRLPGDGSMRWLGCVIMMATALGSALVLTSAVWGFLCAVAS